MPRKFTERKSWMDIMVIKRSDDTSLYNKYTVEGCTTTEISDSWLAENSVYTWACGIQLSAVYIDIGAKITLDNISYIFTRLRAVVPHVPVDYGDKICFTKSLCQSDNHNYIYFKDKVFNRVQKIKRGEGVSQDEDFTWSKCREDYGDFISGFLEPNDPDTNLTYELIDNQTVCDVLSEVLMSHVSHLSSLERDYTKEISLTLKEKEKLMKRYNKES